MGSRNSPAPSRTALIGDLVAEQDRPQASGLIESMANLSLMIGFGIAPVLFVPFGIGFALIADALSFVLAYVLILGVKAPTSARSVKEGVRGNMRREFSDGLRFSFGNLVIRTLIIVYVIVLFGSGAINAFIVFFTAQTLHAPQEVIGLFPVLLGFGLLVGSIIGGALAKRVGLVRIFWSSILILGVLAIVLSRQTSLLPGLIFGFLLGIPNGIMNVALTPMVLNVTPREMVGRVMSVLEPSMMIAQIGSVAVFGTLASTIFSHFHLDIDGVVFGTYDTLVLIPGILCLLAGIIAYFSLRHTTITLGKAKPSDT